MMSASVASDRLRSIPPEFKGVIHFKGVRSASMDDPLENCQSLKLVTGCARMEGRVWPLPPEGWRLPEPTENTEHRTSNIQRRTGQGFTFPFDVGRSMFDVRCSMFDVR